MEETPQAFAACTIIAPNYLPRALVLHDSLKAHHPEAEFWLLLIDDLDLEPAALEAVTRRGIRVLRVQEIGLPPAEIEDFRFIYDITEVSTAYKPWLMETVLRHSPGHVIYLDPDIQFFAPMTELLAALETHELALTPHVLQPMKRDGCQPSELAIKGSGIYNLGFLGVHRAAPRVFGWWQERLRRECYSDIAAQLFTDQRWMDFAPGFFRCHIAPDESLNVAYWNVDQRPLSFVEGRFMIRNRRLGFFHFSGLDEQKPHLLTRHHAGRPRVLLSEHPELPRLIEGYLHEIAEAQRECGPAKAGYSFDFFSDGSRIDLGFRRLFRDALVRAEEDGLSRPPSPFGAEGEQPFFDWLNEASELSERVPVPRLVLLLRETRPDLIAAFPDPCGADAVGLLQWFRTEGRAQFQLPPSLIPPPVRHEAARLPKALVPGLEIVGYLKTESGVGQAARLLARAVESSTIPHTTLVDGSAPSRQQHPFPVGRAKHAADEAYDCCLLCVNADAVASTRRKLGEDYLEGRRVAGLWFWEVETLPINLHAAFEKVDEVWVASEFIRKVLAPISPIPVHGIPLPFGIRETAEPLSRAALGVPEGFFFLFTFDFHSVFRRKNPLDLVAAFKRAFPDPDESGPSLVIKCINGGKHVEDLEHLRYAVRDRKDIVILTEYLDRSVNLALMAACDCYVSLHRSEGLGLTMAEAMMQGKPVIATAYSGNMDFMNERNSYLCRYRMEPVGADASPYCATAIWAQPDLSHAAELMRKVYADPVAAAEKGRLASADLAARFSPEACAAVIEGRWRALRVVERNPILKFPIVTEPTTSYSKSVQMLRQLWKRPFEPAKEVPSLGTLLFQGPNALRKILSRMARHRKPFDKAIVEATSDHDKRLAVLERALLQSTTQADSAPKLRER